jgi:hypothetical protein
LPSLSNWKSEHGNLNILRDWFGLTVCHNHTDR